MRDKVEYASLEIRQKETLYRKYWLIFRKQCCGRKNNTGYSLSEGKGREYTLECIY